MPISHSARAVRASFLATAVFAGTLGTAGAANAAAEPRTAASAAADCKVGSINVCKLKQVRNTGKKCGKRSVAEVRGRGPMTLALTHDETVSNTRSTTVSIEASAISAGVGFDVTKSRTKRMTGSYEVPRGKYGTLKAYPLYQSYTFKVYSSVTNAYVGKGSAKKVIGYCYKHSAR